MTVLRICKTCKKEFLTQKGKYCSKECKPKYKHTCEVCGIEYETSKSKSGGYCSDKCSKMLNQIKKSISLENEEDILTCLECGLKVGKAIASHLKNYHNMTGEEYKKKHNVGVEAIFSKSTRKTLSDNVSGGKNAWFNHCGTLSPFSKNNERITEEERVEKQQIAIQSRMDNGNSTTSLEYYLKKTDDNIEEARELLRGRQSTFSLVGCIEKYGEEAGTKVWQERQDKWQNSLKDKSEEEIERINQAKMNNGSSISKISLTLFNQLDFEGCRYGIKNDFNLGEKMITTNDNQRFMVDYLYNNKIIEFYGDYWHANPNRFKSTDKIKRRSKRMVSNVKEIWDKDEIRINGLLELGYEVLIVWENDYRKNPEKVIMECKEFLVA